MQKYVSDWQGVTWTQTTEPQFEDGTPTDTEVLTSDPEIPDNGKIELATVVEPANYYGTVNVNERAKDVYYQNGIIFAAVAKTNEGLCTADMSDPENPVNLDCIDVQGKGTGIVVSGNYAYVAVDSMRKGLAIVDVSDPANMVLVKSVDVRNAGIDIKMQGNHVFLAINASNSSMVVVNVANPNAPFIASVVNAGYVGTGIEVSGNYAYLSTPPNRLRTYDISNPNSPILKSTYSMPGVSAYGTGGTYKDGYLYWPTTYSNAGLLVLRLSDPTSPVKVGNYNLGNVAGMGTAINGNLLYVAVNAAHEGAKVYDISNPLSLSLVASIDINGKGQNIFATDSFVYFAVDTEDQGIAMVTTSGEGLAPSGNYISKIFDTGSANTDYRSISWLSSDPPGTTLTFQIRTADSEENIEEALFVGLDPLRLGQRYLQWKAYLTSDGNSSPSLEEVIIKYEQ
jgi:hypothetical protein